MSSYVRALTSKAHHEGDDQSTNDHTLHEPKSSNGRGRFGSLLGQGCLLVLLPGKQDARDVVDNTSAELLRLGRKLLLLDFDVLHSVAGRGRSGGGSGEDDTATVVGLSLGLAVLLGMSRVG